MYELITSVNIESVTCCNALILTPTLRKRSPTMLSADIRAEGVSGVPPLTVGTPANKHRSTNHRTPKRNTT